MSSRSTSLSFRGSLYLQSCAAVLEQLLRARNVFPSQFRLGPKLIANAAIVRAVSGRNSTYVTRAAFKNCSCEARRAKLTAGQSRGQFRAAASTAGEWLLFQFGSKSLLRAAANSIMHVRAAKLNKRLSNSTQKLCTFAVRLFVASQKTRRALGGARARSSIQMLKSVAELKRASLITFLTNTRLCALRLLIKTHAANCTCKCYRSRSHFGR